MNVVELRPTPTLWEPFGRDRLRYVPRRSGCYVLATFDGRILYVGLATSLRTRMEQHLDTPAKVAMTSSGLAARFFWVEMADLHAVELGWLNSHLLATGVLPVLNKVASPVAG